MAEPRSTRSRRLHSALVATALLLPILGASPGRASSRLISVPEEVATLQQAIAAVASDGDVIELADGIYPSATAEQSA